MAILIRSEVRPSWKSGFARNAAGTANPATWQHSAGAWAPGLGNTDGQLVDLFGAANGTLNGCTWHPDSLEFNGSGDFVDMGDNYDPGTDPLTVMFWINSTQMDKDFRVVQKRGTGAYGTQAGFAISRFWSGPVNDLWRNVVFDDGSRYVGLEGDGNLDDALDGTWHHMTFVWEPISQTIKGYVDANDAGVGNETNGTVGHIDTPRHLTLGASWNDGSTQSQFFRGNLDDVRIYRAAFTPKQIQETYGRLAPFYRRLTIPIAAEAPFPPPSDYAPHPSEVAAWIPTFTGDNEAI